MRYGGFIAGCLTGIAVTLLSQTLYFRQATHAKDVTAKEPSAPSKRKIEGQQPNPPTLSLAPEAEISTSSIPRHAEALIPDTDAPHPIFGYYSGKPGNFSEWNEKLAQELVDYYWQPQLQQRIAQELAADPVLKEALLTEVNCRQSACRVVLGFKRTGEGDDAVHQRSMQVLHALMEQSWAHAAAGTGTDCRQQDACEAIVYLPRDPDNDPTMEHIPWRRGGHAPTR
ncbi:MAG: hypothetical protein ACOY3E_01380 [Pseudomonadota bacterium]